MKGGKMFIYQDERTSAVRLFSENQVISSAIWNGGFKENAGLIANHTVSPEFKCSIYNYDSYIIENIIVPNRMPENSVIMLTAVPQQNMAYNCFDDYVPMACWATAGISNAVTVGEKAKWCEMKEIVAGTVNVVLIIDAKMSFGALVNAFMLAVEAKVKAFYDLGITSKQSRRNATGTGTDCMVVASRKNGSNAFLFSGSHTVLGENIGKIVLSTITSAISKHAEFLKI